MSDDTPILGLPFILPAQAQKHVTHNESLVMLDVFVQPVAKSRSVQSPPGAIEADVYIVAAGGLGDWAGHDDEIAFVQDGQWRFFPPREGWMFRVIESNETVTYGSGGWQALISERPVFEQLGVATSPDATNRLAVASPAVLLNHAGAGHQLKVNKAAAGDTGSLLFQTGFSGRAEMGLAGNDDFSVKVSADGSSFATALQAEAASGKVTFPAGIEVSGAVTGTGVTQSQTDATPGRLLKTGDFGLGVDNQSAPLISDLDTHRIAGQFAYDASATGKPTSSAGTLTHIIRGGQALAGAQMQLAFCADGSVHTRMLSTNIWGPWLQIPHQGSLLGPVSQSAGRPTGAVFERASGANGSYTRFADGSQICRRIANIDTNSTAVQSFAFPASFAGGNSEVAVSFGHLSATPNDALRPLNLRALAPNGANWELRLVSAGSSSAPGTPPEQLALTAFGRWF
jgi:hypothetical protein